MSQANPQYGYQNYIQQGPPQGQQGPPPQGYGAPMGGYGQQMGAPSYGPPPPYGAAQPAGMGGGAPPGCVNVGNGFFCPNANNQQQGNSNMMGRMPMVQQQQQQQAPGKCYTQPAMGFQAYCSDFKTQPSCAVHYSLCYWA